MSKNRERWAKETRDFLRKKKTQTKRALASYQREHPKATEDDDKGPGDTEDPTTDATFLVIPAFEGDQGTRPVPANIATWHSPAVNIVNENVSTNQTLEDLQGSFSPDLTPGDSYLFEAWVHNLGDMVAPAVNVEFYLRRSGMGTTAESARFLGATVISVPRNGRARATIPFQATAQDTGHHCLFVRATSFNPPDVPSDWSSLIARDLRHVGQQNLNVVGSGTQMALLLTAPPSRRRTTALRLQVVPAAIPAHLANDGCVSKRFKLRKGLKSATFRIESPFDFSETRGSKNSWDVRLQRGVSAELSLRVPGNSQLGVGRVYNVEAIEFGSGKVFDGVTLIVV